MKKTKSMLGVVLSLVMLFSSCAQTNEVGSGQGLLNVSLKSGTDLLVGTRAVDEASYNNLGNYTVQVTDANGLTKLQCPGDELSANMPLTLLIGGYTVKAYTGEEYKDVAYSRDGFYVEGETAVNILGDDRQNVSVTCTPTFGRVSVNFDTQKMSTYYQDYNVTFSGTDAMGSDVITWAKDDTEPWYVRLNPTEETINFTITTTIKKEYVEGNGTSQRKSGTFKLSRNKAYKLNISPVYTPTDQGKLDINIAIDDSTNDSEYDTEVDIDWI